MKKALLVKMSGDWILLDELGYVVMDDFDTPSDAKTWAKNNGREVVSANFFQDTKTKLELLYILKNYYTGQGMYRKGKCPTDYCWGLCRSLELMCTLGYLDTGERDTLSKILASYSPPNHASGHYYPLTRTGFKKRIALINCMLVDELSATGNCLFKYLELLPPKVRKITDVEINRLTVHGALGKLEALGFTFDYGLDYDPYNLRKL